MWALSLLALVWEENCLVFNLIFLFYCLRVLLNVLRTTTERHKPSEIHGTYLRVSLEILRKEKKTALMCVPQSQNSKLTAAENWTKQAQLSPHLIRKDTKCYLFLSFFVCRQMQHHSFRVLSLIIFFHISPSYFNTPSSVNIYSLGRRQECHFKQPSFTSFILPELLKPSPHWGSTESRAASSHSRALKSGFPFLSQSGIYSILKSSILSSEGINLLNTYLSSTRRNKCCSALDLVFDGSFSFVRNLQHFARFCTVCPDFILCLLVLPEHLFRGGLQDIVSVCHVRLNVDIQKENCHSYRLSQVLVAVAANFIPHRQTLKRTLHIQQLGTQSSIQARQCKIRFLFLLVIGFYSW